MHLKNKNGFTLIELVMVTLLLSVLAAVAIPNFIDFRVDAKNAATQGILGNVRSALVVGRAAIALRESPTDARTYPYVGFCELLVNSFLTSTGGVPTTHPVLAGTAILGNSSSKMNYPTGMAANPWSSSNFTHAGSGLTANDLAVTFSTEVNACNGGTLSPAVGLSNTQDIIISSHYIFDATLAVTLASKTAYFNDPGGMGGDETAINGWWGWGYNQTSGEFFAMTTNNGSPAGKTEFWY